MAETEETPPGEHRTSRAGAFARARPLGNSQLLWVEGCLDGEPLFLATRSTGGLEQVYPLRRQMPAIRPTDPRLEWRPLREE